MNEDSFFRHADVEVAVVGDAGVGKSCLVERFAVSDFGWYSVITVTMLFEVGCDQ